MAMDSARDLYSYARAHRIGSPLEARRRRRSIGQGTQGVRALAFEKFGGPEVLEVREVEAPVPGPGQVLVRVLAAGINAFDLQIRQGRAGFPIPLPFIGGMECMGVVKSVGDGVTEWT